MKRLATRLLVLLLALWLPYATGAGAVMEGCAASHSESSMSGASDDAGDVHAVECDEHRSEWNASACADCGSCTHSSASVILFGSPPPLQQNLAGRLFAGHTSWVPVHLAPDFPPPDALRS